jgi:hypothetical protein
MVSTSGAEVLLVSGTPFETDGSWNGKSIVIADPRTGSDGRYTIASVADATRLTLTSSAGTRSGLQYGLRPTAEKWTGLVYDTANKKVLLFQGTNGGGAAYFNETWAYDIPSRRFDLKCRGACSPPPAYVGDNTGLPALVYNPNSGKMLHHQSTGTGAPADWEYDLVTDTWNLLQSGSGPTAPTSPGTIDITMAMAGDKLVTVGKSNSVVEVG